MRKIMKSIMAVLCVYILLNITACRDVKGDEMQDETAINIETEIVESNDETQVKEAETIELTLEYVCSEFDIDESEFEGVDFDEFVEYYSLTYENIHDEAVKFC